MINRGGFSFVAMLVINPVVILFYQNCSMAPISQAKNSPPPIVLRQVASQDKPVIAKIKPSCPENKKECVKAE